MSDDDLNLPQDRVRDRVFYCPRCRQAYGLHHWTIIDSGDDHPIASWYDCAEIRCPKGHERHADLAFVTYENPNPRPRATLGSANDSRVRPFWGLVARLSSLLEKRSANR